MKKIYTLCTIAIFCFLANVNAQFLDRSPGTTKIFSAVHFPSKDTGYAVNQGGEVWKTKDAGKNWNMVNTPTDTLVDVFFVSNDTGFALSAHPLALNYSELWRTTNGGVNWVSVNISTVAYQSIYFFDAYSGFMVGDAGNTKHSIDGGQSWTQGGPAGGAKLVDVHFVSSTIGFAVTDGGRVFQSFDGAQIWSLCFNLGGLGGRYELDFVDASVGYLMRASQGKTYIYRTKNCGGSWDTIVQLPATSMSDIDFVDAANGFAVGAAGFEVGTLFITTDSGKTWATHSMRTNQSQSLLPVTFTALNFYNTKHGIMVGFDGTIAQYELIDTVRGNITDSLTNPVTSGIVYLLGKHPIDIKMDTADVVSILANGDYIFTNVFGGEYLILAMPTSTSFLPTYYGNKTLWTNAQQLTLDQNSYLLEIVVADVPPITNGNGTISGEVRKGTNFGGKLLTKGPPIKDANVALLAGGVTGNPIQYDITGDSGEFLFTKVPAGTYSIAVDVPGVPVDTTLLTITAADSMADVLIEVDSFQMNMTVFNSINENNIYPYRLELYPNPSKDGMVYLLIESNEISVNQTEFSVFNVLGVEVLKAKINNLKKGVNTFAFKTSELPNGNYFVNIRNQSNHSQVSQVKKLTVIR